MEDVIIWCVCLGILGAIIYACKIPEPFKTIGLYLVGGLFVIILLKFFFTQVNLPG